MDGLVTEYPIMSQAAPTLRCKFSAPITLSHLLKWDSFCLNSNKRNVGIAKIMDVKYECLKF